MPSLSRLLLLPLLLVVLTGTTALALRGWWSARQALAESTTTLAVQRQLNDSTVIKLAQATRLSRAQADSLRGLQTAAQTLHGTLVAGVALHVAARDTSLVHPAAPTVLRPDSTRVATFRDSTFAGVVTGTVTAPPCCAALGITYTLHRPAFQPSVGFVQQPTPAGVRTVAVVDWQGESVTVAAPFYQVPPTVRRVAGFVAGGYALGAGAPLAQVGVLARPLGAHPGLSLLLTLGQVVTKGATPTLDLTLRHEF